MDSLENNWLKLIEERPQAGPGGAPLFSTSSITSGITSGIRTSSPSSSSSIKGVHDKRAKEEEEKQRAATNYPKRPARSTGYTASSHAGQLRSGCRPLAAAEAPAPVPGPASEPAPDDDDDAGRAGAGPGAGAGAGADDPSRMSSKGINCGPARPRWGPRASGSDASHIRWLHDDYHDDDDDDGGDLHGQTGTGNLTNWCESAASSAAPQRRLQSQHQQQYEYQRQCQGQCHGQPRPQPAAQAEPAERASQPASQAASGAGAGSEAEAGAGAGRRGGGRICANENKKIQLNYYPQHSRMAALNNQAAAALVASRAAASSTHSAVVGGRRWRRWRAGLRGTEQWRVRKGRTELVTGAPAQASPTYLVMLALLLVAAPLGASLVNQAPGEQRQQQMEADPARPATESAAREHDLLLELLQSTGSLNEANRLIETIIGSKLDTAARPHEPEPAKPDYELIRASGVGSEPFSSSVAPAEDSSQAPPPIRVYLPEPLAEAQLELIGSAGQKQQHLKHRGLLDEIIEASATARPPSSTRSSEPNAKVHYDDSTTELHQLAGGGQRSPGVLLDAARAAELLRASRQIENILSPPPVVGPAAAPVARPAAGNLSAPASDEEGLSNNESISSLTIGSAAPTRQLIANYSHWIVHERVPYGSPASRPEAIRFVQAPALMTTSEQPSPPPGLGSPAPPGAQQPEAGPSRVGGSAAPAQATPASATTSSPMEPASASLAATAAANGFSHEQFLSLGSGQQATQVEQRQQQQQLLLQRRLQPLQQVPELMQQAPEEPAATGQEQAQASVRRQVAVLADGLHEDELATALEPPTLMDNQRRRQPEVASSPATPVAPARRAEVLEVSVFADTLEPRPGAVAAEAPATKGAPLGQTTSSEGRRGALAGPRAAASQRLAVSWPSTTETPVGGAPSPRRPTSAATDLLSGGGGGGGLTGTTRRPARGVPPGQLNNRKERRKEPRKNGKRTNSRPRKKKKPKKQVNGAAGQRSAVSPPGSQQVAAGPTAQAPEQPPDQIRPKVAAGGGVAHLLLGTSSASDRLPSSHPMADGAPASATDHGSSSYELEGAAPAPTSASPPLASPASADSLATTTTGRPDADADADAEASPISGSARLNILRAPLESVGRRASTAASSVTTGNSIAEFPLELAIQPPASPAPVPTSQPAHRPLSTSSDLELTELTHAQWLAQREPTPVAQTPAPAPATWHHSRAATTSRPVTAATSRDMAWWERRPTTPAPLTSLIDQLAGYGNASAQVVVVPSEPLIVVRSQVVVEADSVSPSSSSSSLSGLFGKRLVEEASQPPTQTASATTAAATAFGASKRRPPAARLAASQPIDWPASRASATAAVAATDAAPDEGRFLVGQGLLNPFSTGQPLAASPAQPKQAAAIKQQQTSSKRLPELTMVHLEAQPVAAEPTAAPLEPQRLAVAAAHQQTTGVPPAPLAELKASPTAAPVSASQLFHYKSANRVPALVLVASSPQPEPEGQPQPKLNPILEPAARHPLTTGPLDDKAGPARVGPSQHQLSQQHSVPPALDGQPTTTGSPVQQAVVVVAASGGSDRARGGSQARFNRLRPLASLKHQSQPQQLQQHQQHQQHQSQPQPMNATEQTKAPPSTTNVRANNSNRWLLRRGDKQQQQQRLVQRHGITGSPPGLDSVATSSSVQVAPPAQPAASASNLTDAAPDAGQVAVHTGRRLPEAPREALRVVQEAGQPSAALDVTRLWPAKPASTGLEPAASLGGPNKAHDTKKQSVPQQQQQQQQSLVGQSVELQAPNSIVVGQQLESSLPAAQKGSLDRRGFAGQQPNLNGPKPGATTASLSFVTTPPPTTLLPAETSTRLVAPERLAQQSQLQPKYQRPPEASDGSPEGGPRDGLRRWRQGERKRRRGEPFSSPSSSTSTSTTTPTTTTSTTTTTTGSPTEPVQAPSEPAPPRLARMRVSLANLFKRLPGSGEGPAQQVSGAASSLEAKSVLADGSLSGPGPAAPATSQPSWAERPAQQQQQHLHRHLQQHSLHQAHNQHQPRQQLQVAGPAPGALADELRASALVKTMINLGAPGGTFQSSSAGAGGAVMSEAATQQPPAAGAEPGPRIRGDLHKSGQMERRHQRRKFIAAASGSEFPSVDSRASLDQQAVVWESAISSSSSSSSASSPSSPASPSPSQGQPPVPDQHPSPPQPAAQPEPALSGLSGAPAAEADWRLQTRASRPHHRQPQEQPAWHPPGDVSPWTPSGGAGWRASGPAAAPPGPRYAHRAPSTPTGRMLNGSQPHQDTDRPRPPAAGRQEQQQQQAGVGITWLASGTSQTPPTLLVYDELLGSEQSATPARTTQASQPLRASSSSSASFPSVDQLLPATGEPDYRPPILGPHHHNLHQLLQQQQSSSSGQHQGPQLGSTALESWLSNQQLRAGKPPANASPPAAGSPLFELARRDQLSSAQELAILIIVFSCGALVLALVAMALSIKCRIAFNKATSKDTSPAAASRAAPIVNKSAADTRIVKRVARRSARAAAKRALLEAESKLLLAQQRMANKHRQPAASDSPASGAADLSSSSEASINLVAQGDQQPVLADAGKTAAKLMLLSPPGASKVPLATLLKRSLKRRKRSKRRQAALDPPIKHQQAAGSSFLTHNRPAAGGTLRQRISGTITSRLLKMQLPRLLPYFALDYSNNPHQQQHHRANRPAFDVHQPTTNDLQASNGKKLASPLTVGDLLLGSANTQHHMDQESPLRPLPNMEQENFHLKSPAKQIAANNATRLKGHKNRPEACEKPTGKEFLKKRSTTKLTGCQCVSCSRSKQEPGHSHTSNQLQEELLPPGSSQHHQPLRKPRLPFGAASSVLRQPDETVTGSIYGKEQPEVGDFKFRRDPGERTFWGPGNCEDGICSQAAQVVDAVDIQRHPRKQTSAINGNDPLRHNLNEARSSNISSNESNVNLHHREAATGLQQFSRPLPEGNRNQPTAIVNRYQDEETDNYYHLNNVDYAGGVASSDYQDEFGDSLATGRENQQQATNDNQLVEAIVCSNNYFCSNELQQTRATRQNNQRPDCNCKLVLHPI